MSKNNSGFDAIVLLSHRGCSWKMMEQVQQILQSNGLWTVDANEAQKRGYNALFVHVMPSQEHRGRPDPAEFRNKDNIFYVELAPMCHTYCQHVFNCDKGQINPKGRDTLAAIEAIKKNLSSQYYKNSYYQDMAMATVVAGVAMSAIGAFGLCGAIPLAGIVAALLFATGLFIGAAGARAHSFFSPPPPQIFGYKSIIVSVEPIAEGCDVGGVGISPVGIATAPRP